VDIRGRRLSKSSSRVSRFTSSIGSDGPLARHVIRINEAHLLALMKSREVDRSAGSAILKHLSGEDPEKNYDAYAEDIHQAIEQAAVDSLGVEMAGAMNLGKSRNDQVATAVRMELRSRLIDLGEAVNELRGSILALARREGKAIIPGYTHLQRAQPVTLAHHMFAHFDSLGRDAERIGELYERVNASPMGAAALAGTSVNVDRREVAELLGFPSVLENAMDSVSSRDFLVEALSVAEILMLDLSRLAEEVVLWSTREFRFLEVSDEYATSSSIMPQKKNPVVAEMVRAKCGSVAGDLVAVCTILKALPYSYNLDLQEATPHLWRGIADATESATMMAGLLRGVKFNVVRMERSVAGDFSTATSLANHLVKTTGITFRQSHAVVGDLVRRAVEAGITLQESVSKHLPAVSKKVTGKTIRLDPFEVDSVLDPGRALEKLVTAGAANPSFIKRGLESRLAALQTDSKTNAKLKSQLLRADENLQSQVNAIIKGVKG
jgi:argininosuccinate lyase